MSGISRINAVYLFLLGVKMKLNFRELWLSDPRSRSTPPVSIYCISVLALQSSYIRAWALITKRKTPAPTTTLALKQPGPHKTGVHWISPQMEPGITIFSWSEHSRGGVCLWRESISPHVAPITDLFSVHPGACWISNEIYPAAVI